MADPPRRDPDRQLADICRVLNGFGVAYVVFGSHVGRLRGAPVETDDVDLVPDKAPENLQRLADALNSLRPRWRVEGMAGGVKIDGRWLEPRHFQAQSTAVGLETSMGPIDIVLEPRGFEAGFAALSPSAVTVIVGGDLVSEASTISSPPSSCSAGTRTWRNCRCYSSGRPSWRGKRKARSQRPSTM